MGSQVPWKVVALAVGGMGCFSKPVPPEEIVRDAPDLDGEIDGMDALKPCTTFGEWGTSRAITAVNLEGEDDFAPALSGDNKRLVFQRNVGPLEQMWESVWSDDLGDFGPPTPIDVPDFSGGPTLSPDGKKLWFNRYPGDNSDIYVIERADLDSPFETARRVAPFNTDVDELDIAFSATLLDAVVHVWAGVDPGFEIAIASRSTIDVPFDPWTVIAGLENNGYDCCATLSPDGLEILWEGRSGPYGVYSSTRPTRGAPFGPPVQFSPLDDGFTNVDPQFSYDGTKLVYASDRSSGTGAEEDYDIYILERACLD